MRLEEAETIFSNAGTLIEQEREAARKLKANGEKGETELLARRVVSAFSELRLKKKLSSLTPEQIEVLREFSKTIVEEAGSEPATILGRLIYPADVEEPTGEMTLPRLTKYGIAFLEMFQTDSHSTDPRIKEQQRLTTAIQYVTNLRTIAINGTITLPPVLQREAARQKISRTRLTMSS